MVSFQTPERLELSVMRVVEEINNLHAFINWDQLSEYELWYELIACILGSNVKFECAQSFVYYLDKLGLLDIMNPTLDYAVFELKIAEALSQPIFPSSGNDNRQKYRYPMLRANHIRRTAESIYKDGSSIKVILERSEDPFEARYQLTLNAIGIGPKQASLFLRNIGYAHDLAILDIHVLRYMSLLKLLSHPIDKLTNLVTYEKWEAILLHYAKGLNTSLSYLDTAIWVVMRVYQKEFIK
jgi:N-glycosylase/DNA lyase